MFAFASMIFSFLGGPIAKALVQAYQAHLTATTTDKQTAANLAGKEIGAQVAETNAITQYRIAEIGHWYEPDKLLGYCVAIYFAKLLVWDKVLGLGVTDGLGTRADPNGGFAAWTANIIIMFYFGKRGFENVARILRR